uniref:Uncharacterized protein n=1 Tax=Meloidogyne floridensis TaxID=298350 RepID=A0A915NN78_9BILA
MMKLLYFSFFIFILFELTDCSNNDKGKKVVEYGEHQSEVRGGRGSRSGRETRRGNRVPHLGEPAQGSAVQGRLTPTNQEIQKLIRDLTESIQAKHRQDFIDKRRYKNHKKGIEKEFEYRKMESKNFLKGIKNFGKKTKKEWEDFKYQKTLEFNTMLGNFEYKGESSQIPSNQPTENVITLSSDDEKSSDDEEIKFDDD